MNINPTSGECVDDGSSILNEILLAGIKKSSQSKVIAESITNTLLNVTRRVLKAKGITKLSQVEQSEHHVMKAVCGAVIEGRMDNLSDPIDELETVAARATIEFSLRKPSKTDTSLEDIFLAEEYSLHEHPRYV